MATERAQISNGHLDVLDGLRGSMAYWVLIGHVFSLTGMHPIPILASPAYAVNGFMILSGFLMTWHYVRRADKESWTSSKTWIAFYVRRFFRISPLYYCLLVPAYLLLNKYSEWQRASEVVHTAATRLDVPLTWQHVVLHLSYLFGLLPEYHSSLPIPDWSISLEMQFYLVFPFLMLLVLRFGWPALCVVAGAIWYTANMPALGLAHGFRVPSLLCLSLLWFVIGMVWAGRYATSRKPHVPSIVFGCVLALCSRDPHCIVLVSAFAFVLFMGDVPVLGRIAVFCRTALSSPLAKFMAEASYAVYLVHLLILRPLAAALITHTHLGRNRGGIIALLVTTVASYLLALILRPVETWGISIGRKLAKQVTGEANRARPRSPAVDPKPDQVVA